MDLDSIRAAGRSQPFRPFVIHTGSGESYPVRHPETLSFAPDVSVVVVMPGGGRVAMIDLASVTEITDDFNARPSNAGN